MAKDAGGRDFLPSDGERALIVGPTGSGKTLFAVWLLRRLPVSPILIIDTKDETKFPNLPKSVICGDWSEVGEMLEKEEFDFVIFRPPADELGDPEELDEYLWLHYSENHGVPIYIDEVYSFHSNGRARRGLVALLTRGRSRGITTVMSTQRPAWISLFVLTETQKFYIFPLTHDDDKKRMGKIIADYADLPALPAHAFYFYRIGENRVREFTPIAPDKGMDTGYTEAHNRTDQEPAPSQDLHDWL